MKAQIFNWKNEINEIELNKVIETLDNGGVIIFPTDTVYGIACNCFNEQALDKIFSFKKRLKDKPINVLTNSIKKIDLVADSISLKEKKLIEHYMPGALTIILNKKNNVPDSLTSNLKTVGVRIPNNLIALKILESVDYPLATTSVNISGEIPGIKITDFLDEFKDKVDIIIDGGESKLKEPSTIVRVEDNEIKVLREGSIKIN